MSDLPHLQSMATPAEQAHWSSCGGKFFPDVWLGPDGKPCLPHALFPALAKLSHGQDHVGRGGMCSTVNSAWYTRGFSMFAQEYCKKCVICAMNNPTGALRTPQVGHPPIAKQTI